MTVYQSSFFTFKANICYNLHRKVILMCLIDTLNMKLNLFSPYTDKF